MPDIMKPKVEQPILSGLTGGAFFQLVLQPVSHSTAKKLKIMPVHPNYKVLPDLICAE